MTTDEELAGAFGRGDDRALAALYQRWRAPLFVFCARMLGQAEEARDVVQDIFAGAYERRGELAQLRSFRAWLFTVARNRCLSTLRLHRNRARLVQSHPDPAAPAPASAAVESADDTLRVQRALAVLPPDQREALILREYQDLSYREIAEITGATESAVKSRIFRARQALCTLLRPTDSEGDPSCDAKIEDRR